MRKLVLISSFLMFLFCSEKKTETITTDSQPEVIADEIEYSDSLNTIIYDEEDQHVTESADTESVLKDLSGKHSLSLQWISWEKPGVVNFTKTAPREYKISGSQQRGKDYLKIDGEIQQISDEELQFEGTIETFVENNGGKCLRTGPQLFLVTQNRKYWRLQNMTECFGLTDYVDIYF